jgi:uncharacterized membrane protein YphA (DoxX/SURF4 family)
MDEQPISASTTEAGQAGEPRRPSRGAGRALWAAQVVLAAIFLMVSYPKLTLDPMAVAGFAAMGFSPIGAMIIGWLEVAGAIGLLVPRLVGLAAIGVVALMIGATTATILTMGAAPALMPVAIGVVAALVARGRWYETVELARWVRSFVASR